MSNSFIESRALVGVVFVGTESFTRKYTDGGESGNSLMDLSPTPDKIRCYSIPSAGAGNFPAYLLNNVLNGDPYGEFVPRTAAGSSDGWWSPKETGQYIFSSTGFINSTSGSSAYLQIRREDVGGAIDYLAANLTGATSYNNMAGSRLVTGIQGGLYALQVIFGTGTSIAAGSANRLYIYRVA